MTRLLVQPDVGRGGTDVLLAVLWIWTDEGRVTVRAVADAVGSSVSTVHAHLVHLRDLGLLTWDNGKAGTLRPTVAVVRPRVAA